MFKNIFNDKLVLLSTLYMDAYLLARMFKYEQEEVIVYVGSHHVSVIAEFLMYVKAEPIIQIDNNDTCIHISDEHINDRRNL